MRFMIVVRADANSEAGIMPEPQLFEDMAKFNEQLLDAGALLAADGLHPSNKGARVKMEGGRLRVIDGPFAETKELIAGFWIIQAKDKAEALSWVQRIPGYVEGSYVDLFQVFDPSDFEGKLPDEIVAKEHELRNRQMS